VLWLRSLNPWSPDSPWSTIDRQHLEISEGDVGERIGGLASASFDAVLHDPPRFAVAGELYSQAFYAELARVLKPRGRLFHYTGSPNQRSRGRNLAGEVVTRLGRAGFAAEPRVDGVLAMRAGRG
jgi:predicted methyltransferase